jgi:hypothetical protein
MRLNWFGPLPPVAGPASLYAGRLLPFLKGRADVSVWTPQLSWDRGLERWAEVHCFHPDRLPWAELNLADATLFHLGCDTTTPQLLEVLARHPGIAVLHDDAGSLPERALAAVVFSEETFRGFKPCGRPLLLSPLPWADGEAGLSHALSDYKGHAETLLSFADESRRFCLRLTAEELALRAAREMSLWTADATTAAELPRAALEIHKLAA